MGLQLRSETDLEDAKPNLSPLFTSQLQPLLPQLRIFHTPLMQLPRLSKQATAVLLDSTAAFLIAYATQLQVLTIGCAAASAGSVVERVRQCSQPTDLFNVVRWDIRGHAIIPEHHVDAEQLDEAVASLPSLPLLTELRVQGLYWSVRAMTQLLNQCPNVRSVTVADVKWHLPTRLELPGGRAVELTRFNRRRKRS